MNLLLTDHSSQITDHRSQFTAVDKLLKKKYLGGVNCIEKNITFAANLKRV